jgi:hypothetical protein
MFILTLNRVLAPLQGNMVVRFKPAMQSTSVIALKAGHLRSVTHFRLITLVIRYRYASRTEISELYLYGD